MSADANIYVIIDGSGSMSRVKNDVVKGINDFIVEQQNDANPGDDIRFWLTTFDSNIMEVYQGEDIGLVNPVSVKETFLGGGTALLDAIGKTLTTAEADAALTNTVVIYTDGHENASREFSNEEIAKLIEKLTNTGAWQFVYLGAEFEDFAKDRAQGTLRASSVGGTYSAVNTPKTDIAGTFSRMSQTVSLRNKATVEELDEMKKTGLLSYAQSQGIDWNAPEEPKEK